MAAYGVNGMVYGLHFSLCSFSKHGHVILTCVPACFHVFPLLRY